MNKSKIERKLRKKTNTELVETIIKAKKNSKWNEVANIISMPRRKQISANLGEINKQAKENEIILVPGKVLSEGEITKKIKIAALAFSEKAEDKLKKAKVETIKILREIEKNPEMKNVHMLKNMEK